MLKYASQHSTVCFDICGGMIRLSTVCVVEKYCALQEGWRNVMVRFIMSGGIEHYANYAILCLAEYVVLHSSVWVAE